MKKIRTGANPLSRHTAARMLVELVILYCTKVRKGQKGFKVNYIKVWQLYYLLGDR